VLGNSGEEGPALVRFGAEPATGLGLAYDHYGTLWDRAGKGTLNRYSLDGRLLAQYRLPGEFSPTDQLVLSGDTLIFLIRRRLYTMPINTPPGAEPKPLPRLPEISTISFGMFEAQVAIANKEEVSLLNIARGEIKHVANVPDVREVELGPDGAVYTTFEKGVRKFINGVEVTDSWPGQRPGTRNQLLRGFWYGQNFHTTIRRFSAAMEPKPGVVLGGMSGSMIGRLEANPELHNGLGLARIRENLFAISSNTGIVHLLEWKNGPQQFEIVRRIGSVPYCSGLGLDDNGGIWCNGGSWSWGDNPDTPLRFGVRAPEFPGTSQVAMRRDGQMLAAATTYGKFALYAGKLTSEVTVSEVAEATEFPAKDVTGAAAITHGKRSILLVISAAGQGQAFDIDGKNRVAGAAVPVTLQFSTPVKACTSLAMRDATTLLVAADGAVIELQPQSEGVGAWNEIRLEFVGSGPARKIRGDDLHRCRCRPTLGGGPRPSACTLPGPGHQ
jgi:hypothetical protein